MTATEKSLGIAFPVDAGATGASLLESCDPINARLLCFYKAVLCACIGDAIVAAMSGQAKAAVVSTTNVDPDIWPEGTAWKFPLLAIFPVSDEPSFERTMQREATITKYSLQWVLPAIVDSKAQAVFSVLPAARRLLLAATAKVSNLEYEDGSNAFDGTSIERITLGAAQYGLAFPNGANSGQPALQMDIMVTHSEEWAVPGVDYDFTKIALGISGTGDEPEQEDLVAHTDVTPTTEG